MALENVMRVDNGNIIDGAMPQTYPATQVMMTDGVTSVEDALDGLITTRTYTSDNTTLAQYTSVNIQFDVTLSGYTALGLVEFYVNDTAVFTPSRWWFDSTKKILNVTIINNYYDSRTASLRVTVLYVKS